jgi:hypothetical protein
MAASFDPRASTVVLASSTSRPAPGGQTIAAARRAASVLATDISSNILAFAAAEARARGSRQRRHAQRVVPRAPQMMSALSEAERERTWAEIEDALREFEGPDGFVAPCELVVGGGTA